MLLALKMPLLVIFNNKDTEISSSFIDSINKIIAFAKQLILDGKKEDAKKLNRAVELLGSEIDPEIIINKITDEPNSVYKNKTNSDQNPRKFDENKKHTTVKKGNDTKLNLEDHWDSLNIVGKVSFVLIIILLVMSIFTL